MSRTNLHAFVINGVKLDFLRFADHEPIITKLECHLQGAIYLLYQITKRAILKCRNW